MGTSRTYDGPGDRPALLPQWALPGGGPPPVPPEDEGADEPGDASGEDGVDPGPALMSPAAAPVGPALWRSAKGTMNSWARGGGGRPGLARAGRAYARAKGGSTSAARQAVQGRATAARVVEFLGDVANRGLGPALESLGLRGYADRPAEEVFAAIANTITPPGATLEEAAARRAADEVLARLYDEYADEDGLARLESMTAEDVGEAAREVISAYVYHRWLEELGKSIEAGTTTPAEAVRLEREVHQYVSDIVQLEIPNDQLLTLDFKRPEGQALITRLIEEAYDLLENG